MTWVVKYDGVATTSSNTMWYRATQLTITPSFSKEHGKWPQYNKTSVQSNAHDFSWQTYEQCNDILTLQCDLLKYNNSEHHGTLHFHSKHCITIKMPVQYVSGPEFQFHDACVENSCVIIQLVHVTSSGWDKSWNCHLINYILVAELVIYRRNIFPLTPQQED